MKGTLLKSAVFTLAVPATIAFWPPLWLTAREASSPSFAFPRALGLLAIAALVVGHRSADVGAVPARVNGRA
jgi:hypothetical protein